MWPVRILSEYLQAHRMGLIRWCLVTGIMGFFDTGDDIF